MAEHAGDPLTVVCFVDEVQLERQVLLRFLRKPQKLELGKGPRHDPYQQLLKQNKNLNFISTLLYGHCFERAQTMVSAHRFQHWKYHKSSLAITKNLCYTITTLGGRLPFMAKQVYQGPAKRHSSVWCMIGPSFKPHQCLLTFSGKCVT